jgi:cyanate permease
MDDTGNILTASPPDIKAIRATVGVITPGMAGSNYPVLIVSMILIGIALGGSFPLALSYIGLRARNGQQAVELSGMTQSTGYVLTAVGPNLNDLLEAKLTMARIKGKSA